MQRKYADFLAERDGLPSPHADTAPSANAIVNRIYGGLAEDARWPLADGFSALPVGAQEAITAELGRTSSVPAFTSDSMLDDGLTVTDAVAEFASRPEGEELLAAWGGKAERNVVALYCRMARALSGITPSERHAAAGWGLACRFRQRCRLFGRWCAS